MEAKIAWAWHEALKFKNAINGAKIWKFKRWNVRKNWRINWIKCEIRSRKDWNRLPKAKENLRINNSNHRIRVKPNKKQYGDSKYKKSTRNRTGSSCKTLKGKRNYEHW